MKVQDIVHKYVGNIQNKAITDFASKKENIIKSRMVVLNIPIPTKPNPLFKCVVNNGEESYYYKETRIITFVDSMPNIENNFDSKGNITMSITQAYY